MAAFAYVFGPVTGALAYFMGSDARTRFHGFRAVALGTLWPALLYLAAVISPAITAAVFAAGILLWVALIVATAAGRDLRLPGDARVRGWTERAPGEA